MINIRLFTSTDGGETWDLLYSWKGEKYGFPVKLVLTNQAFYLAFSNGIFWSDDTGKTWKNINDGLTGRSDHFIKSFIETQNTFFAGTDNGCYRYSGDSWKRLEFPVPIIRTVSTATTKGKLYVVAELGWEVSHELKRNWGIFRSTDLGDSWKDITPTNAWHRYGHVPKITLIAVGETLIAMEQGMVRSIDGGDTWLSPQAPGTSPTVHENAPVAVVKDDIIYIGSHDGLYYSTNLGESWHKMNIRQKGGNIYNLIAFKKPGNGQSTPSLLYARVDRDTLRGGEIKKTDDGGNSWKPVQIAMTMTTPVRKIPPNITQIVKYGDVLYAKAWDFATLDTRIYSVSSDGRTLVPLQGVPVFRSEKLVHHSGKLTDHFTFLNDQFSKGHVFGATQFFKQMTQPIFWKRGYFDLIWGGLSGAFAVDNNTFYMEYNFKLFRWKPDDTEWHNTGLEETVELSEDIVTRRNLKLAVSGNTVCVGKRDGHLAISFDSGTNWIDLTPALPFPVKTFKEIVFAGSTVYVATDAGIITSDDGRDWHIVTDSEGTNLIMEKLTVDGTTVYGVTKKTGIYRLESGTWKQIVSEIPDSVTSLAVDGDTLYVGTENRGMLHFNLEK